MVGFSLVKTRDMLRLHPITLVTGQERFQISHDTLVHGPGLRYQMAPCLVGIWDLLVWAELEVGILIFCRLELAWNPQTCW